MIIQTENGPIDIIRSEYYSRCIECLALIVPGQMAIFRRRIGGRDVIVDGVKKHIGLRSHLSHVEGECAAHYDVKAYWGSTSKHLRVDTWDAVTALETAKRSKLAAGAHGFVVYQGDVPVLTEIIR